MTCSRKLQYDFLFDETEKEQKKLPHAFIVTPVYEEFVEDGQGKQVGFLVGITVLTNLFDRLLPEGTDGIIAVLENTCGDVMSFELSSSKAAFLGYTDVHEISLDEYERAELNLEMYEELTDGMCQHDLYLYPSTKFQETYTTNRPAIYASVVAMAFGVTIILFILYDWMVNRRQNKVMKAASRTQAIVTSLFPKEIGRKLVEEAYNNDSNDKKDQAWKKQGGPALQTILGHDGQINADANRMTRKAPLADLVSTPVG